MLRSKKTKWKLPEGIGTASFTIEDVRELKIQLDNAPLPIVEWLFPIGSPQTGKELKQEIIERQKQMPIRTWFKDVNGNINSVTSPHE